VFFIVCVASFTSDISLCMVSFYSKIVFGVAISSVSKCGDNRRDAPPPPPLVLDIGPPCGD